MNKIIVFSLLLISFSSFLDAGVQDLPDVEISGPSSLKATIGKSGLFYSDLLLPDVMDSLYPIIPDLPTAKASILKQKKNALNLQLGSKSIIYGSFITHNFLVDNNAISAYVDYLVLQRNWTNLNIAAAFHQKYPKSLLRVMIKSLSSYSPYKVEMQLDNALQFDFSLFNTLMFNRPTQVTISTEMHNNQAKIKDELVHYNEFYWYPRMDYITTIKSGNQLKISVAYIQNTPYYAIEHKLINSDNDRFLSFYKGFSIRGIDKRLVPGLHLSQRLWSESNYNLHLLNYSDARIFTNYHLLQQQPWQYPQKEGFVVFTPVDFNIIFNNTKYFIVKQPLLIRSVIRTQYSLDEPIFTSVSSTQNTDDVPFIHQQRTLKNSLEVVGEIRNRSNFISQRLEIGKGWYPAHSYKHIAYLPLISIHTDYMHRREKYIIQSWIRQYYNTKNDLNQHMREAVDIGAHLEYIINPDFSIYLKATNIPNKGLYQYRTIPAEPAAYMAGFVYTF